MLGTAPKRPYIPIIVWAGANVKAYLAWGRDAVARMVLECPVCGTRLIGNGWRQRVARTRSKTFEAEPAWIPVHQLVCPNCRDAGRHPWNFRVLPSFLFPFKHFLQGIRLMVFDRAWGAEAAAAAPAPVGAAAAPAGCARAVGEALGVDRCLVRIWLVLAQAVMAAALPALGAALEDCKGTYPAVSSTASLWQRWWALGLALRVALAARDEALGQTPGSVLEWMAVWSARRRSWWAP